MRDRVPQMEYVFCDTNKELPETYEYLNRIEAYLGKKIIRIEATRGFDHWLTLFQGYLPSVQVRWCTTQLKLKPFEAYVGDEPVINYIGLRSDEDRDARVSHKPNISVVYPFKEHGVDFAGVHRILIENEIGLPPYLEWGRSRSGCYFCFFQKPIEWIRLLETHPDLFELAQNYEAETNAIKGGFFKWNDSMTLKEMRKPENIERIKRRYEEGRKRRWEGRPNKTLMETLTDLEVEDPGARACTICHL